MKRKIEEEVEIFFRDIESKSPKEIKKIKRLAMSKNIPLREEKRLFCIKCFNVYKNPTVRIKKGFKIIKCGKCKFRRIWKLN